MFQSANRFTVYHLQHYIQANLTFHTLKCQLNIKDVWRQNWFLEQMQVGPVTRKITFFQPEMPVNSQYQLERLCKDTLKLNLHKWENTLNRLLLEKVCIQEITNLVTRGFTCQICYIPIKAKG